MSDKPKRRWFRFHLSTAFGMMLVAGCMIGVNTRCQVIFSNYEEVGVEHCRHCQYGWPMIAREEFEGQWTVTVAPLGWPSHWNAIGITVDALVAVALVLASGFFGEWLIRRREGRKP